MMAVNEEKQEYGEERSPISEPKQSSPKVVRMADTVPSSESASTNTVSELHHEGGHEEERRLRVESPGEEGVAPPQTETGGGVASQAESAEGTAPPTTEKEKVASPKDERQGGVVAQSGDALVGVAPQSDSEPQLSKQQQGENHHEEEGEKEEEERMPQAIIKEGMSSQLTSQVEGVSSQMESEKVVEESKEEPEKEVETAEVEGAKGPHDGSVEDKEPSEERIVTPLVESKEDVPESEEGMAPQIESKAGKDQLEISESESLKVCVATLPNKGDEGMVPPQIVSESRSETINSNKLDQLEESMDSLGNVDKNIAPPFERENNSDPQVEPSKDEVGVGTTALVEERETDSQVPKEKSGTDSGRTTPKIEHLSIEADEEDKMEVDTTGQTEVDRENPFQDALQTAKAQEAVVAEDGVVEVTNTSAGRTDVDVDPEEGKNEDDSCEEKMEVEADELDKSKISHVTSAEDSVVVQEQRQEIDNEEEQVEMEVDDKMDEIQPPDVSQDQDTAGDSDPVERGRKEERTDKTVLTGEVDASPANKTLVVEKVVEQSESKMENEFDSGEHAESVKSSEPSVKDVQIESSMGIGNVTGEQDSSSKTETKSQTVTAAAHSDSTPKLEEVAKQQDEPVVEPEVDPSSDSASSLLESKLEKPDKPVPVTDDKECVEKVDIKADNLPSKQTEERVEEEDGQHRERTPPSLKDEIDGDTVIDIKEMTGERNSEEELEEEEGNASSGDKEQSKVKQTREENEGTIIQEVQSEKEEETEIAACECSEDPASDGKGDKDDTVNRQSLSEVCEPSLTLSVDEGPESEESMDEEAHVAQGKSPRDEVKEMEETKQSESMTLDEVKVVGSRDVETKDSTATTGQSSPSIEDFTTTTAADVAVDRVQSAEDQGVESRLLQASTDRKADLSITETETTTTPSAPSEKSETKSPEPSSRGSPVLPQPPALVSTSLAASVSSSLTCSSTSVSHRQLSSPPSTFAPSPSSTSADIVTTTSSAEATIPIVSLLALSTSKAPPTSSSLATVPSLTSLATKSVKTKPSHATESSASLVPGPAVTTTTAQVQHKTVGETSSICEPEALPSKSGDTMSGDRAVSQVTVTASESTVVTSSTAQSDSVTATSVQASEGSLLAMVAASSPVVSVPKTTSVSPPPLTSSSSSSSSVNKDTQSAAKLQANPVSVITQVSSSLTSTTPKTSTSAAYLTTFRRSPVNMYAVREQNLIMGMSAERLKVGKAEVLHMTGESDVQIQQQKIEVKSREEIMGKVPPQVAVIPPIIDLTRTPEYSQMEKSKGHGSSDMGKGKSPSMLMGVAGMMSDGQQRSSMSDSKNVEKPMNVSLTAQDLKSHVGELKTSAHPVARRIWMSSCRPLDPASLERIGIDSKGTVYWYDGGKNMFQSPPSNDPAYKPSESELQLACKSMVQWTAKLKDLRHSNIEADMKLAQIIKDHFLSRVRIATQRKPRETTSAIQKLQAVHSMRQPGQLSQQPTVVSSKPAIALTTSQAPAAVATATGAVAIATPSGDTPGSITPQKTAQIVQGSFPQGSILVVPHPTHPFHAVLPVFANTAVLMPQAAATAAVSGATASTSSVDGSSHAITTAPSAGIAVVQNSTNDKKVPSKSSVDSDTGKLPASSSLLAPPNAQAILVQAPIAANSQSLSAMQVSPSSIIQLSGSRSNLPASVGMSSSDRAKKDSSSVSSKDHSSPSSSASSKEKQLSEVHHHHQLQQQQQTSHKAGLSATLASPQTATIALHPSLIPQALASGMLAAVPGGSGVKFQDFHRQALALSGVPVMPVMPVKVGEAVKLSTVDFESQSIEITGEVPIKKVEVDKVTGEFIPVPLTASTTEPSDGERTESEAETTAAVHQVSKEDNSSIGKNRTQKSSDEDGHVDVEGESRLIDRVGAQEKKRLSKSPVKESRETGGGAAFSGHSSSDIMSAQLLLSLTDGPHNDWSSSSAHKQQLPPEQADRSESPVKTLLNKEPSVVLSPIPLKSSGRDETASPASSTSQTATSGGRKRKQKPIASAKPDDEGIQSTPKTTPTPKGRKGARKVTQKQGAEETVEEQTAEPKSSSKKKQTTGKDKSGEKETPGRSKQLSPEELLVLLDIPPSGVKQDSSKTKTPVSKPKSKGKDKPNQDGRFVLQSSKATAKMEQLKASRAGKPLKEYVIETDSESESSSSGTSSSRFSPDSGSSSESSSDSSSEEGGGGEGGGEKEEGSETKTKPPPKKVPARGMKGSVARGRGARGRGGRIQRKGKKEASSSAESSSEGEEETVENKKKPARGGRGRARTRARGGGSGGASRGGGRGMTRGARSQESKPSKPQCGHIVSIPTNLLTHKPVSGKKRKAVSREAEVEKATTADYIPDLPVDLATIYATKGGVDLGTLSELTNSVKEDGLEVEMSGSRSKRTCVRMREEISKLQEILKDSGSPEVRPTPPTRTRGRGKGHSSGRTSDAGGGGAGSAQESATPTPTSAPAPVKKYRRPAYSQFTHKRRKRRRKQPEEEALWQPASRTGGAGESYKPVYLFSTSLANKAAAAVEKSRYNTIIQFHQAQPKDPGFLRLPQVEKQSKPEQQGGSSVDDRKGMDGGGGDSGEEEEPLVKETRGSAPRGQKRRSSGRSGEGGVSTRRSRTNEAETVEKIPSPQPFLRSSRRLKQQRNRSLASPPLQSPSSTDGPRSPLPPSPPSGVRPRPRRTSQTMPSGGTGGSGQQQQQRSLRKRRNVMQDESPLPSPETDPFKTRASQDVEEMDSPSDDEEGRMREEDLSNGELGAKKKARLDSSEADKNVLSSPDMQSPEQQRSIPPPNSREEENYTICHGTPVNKPVAGGDISSPKSWSQHQQQQHQPRPQQQVQQQQQQYQPHPPAHQQLHPHQQMQQYTAAAAAQAAGHAQQQQHHQHRQPTTPSSDAVRFSPPMGQIHPGSSSSPVGGQFDHRSAAASAGGGGGGGGGHSLAAGATSVGLNGGSTSTTSGGRNIHAEYAHRHHLMSAEHAHHRDAGSGWSAAAAAAAGLHPQFSPVPGAYPGTYPPMYNPGGIPGMHYSGQPMPGANYPYPMPYAWGHHHPAEAAGAVPQFASHSDHVIQQQQHHAQQQQQQQQHRQAATSKDVPSHHDVLQHPHIGAHTPEPSQSASVLMRGQHAAGSSSAQSVNVTSSSTSVGKRGHYPLPGSASPHTLSHQVPHGAGVEGHHLPPAGAPFPYGFDSSAHSLSHMHMLQQSQMQLPQIRSLHGVPPHHLPPHMAPRGIWYSPQHMAAHQMLPGGGVAGEIPGHPAHSKKSSKSSKSAASADLDKNRNANNNNSMDITPTATSQSIEPTQEYFNLMSYKSSASFPSSQHQHGSSSLSSNGAQFSIDRLAAPYSSAVQLTPNSQRQRINSDGSVADASMILDVTRQDQ